MPISCRCASCQTKFAFADEHCGKRARCKTCGATFVIASSGAIIEPRKGGRTLAPQSSKKVTRTEAHPAPHVSPSVVQSGSARVRRGQGLRIAVISGGVALLIAGVAIGSFVFRASGYRESEVAKSLPKNAAPKDPPGASAPVAPPAASDFEKVRTAAVIDQSGLPVGALFEARMIRSTKLVWTERTLIDQLFAEQNLQGLFSPEAGAKRTAIAKILKADVLALVRSRARTDGKKMLELVVFESQRGLRLATHAMPATENAEADSAALEGVFQRALAKVSEQILEVIAVPAFVNLDLDYRQKHLATGFAKRLEFYLQQRKGVLLVEFDEAKTLAQETELAGATIAHPLPLLLLGDFRHDGVGAARRARVSLTMQRGNKVLGARSQANLQPDDCLTALLTMSDELMNNVANGSAPVAIDRATEIEQFTRRAFALQQNGNWTDCATLLEAALLLDPQNVELRMNAVHAYAMIARQHFPRAEADAEEAAKGLQVYRRLLEHVDAGCRPVKKFDPPRPPQETAALQAPDHEAFMACVEARLALFLAAKVPSLQELCTEVFDLERRICLDLCRARARAGYGDDAFFLNWTLVQKPYATQTKMVCALTQELKELPFAKERILLYANLRVMLHKLNDSDVFLAMLESDSHPDLKAAAEILNQNRPSNRVIKVNPVPERDLRKERDELGGLPPTQRVSLTVVTGDPREIGKDIRFFNLCVPLGNGQDLITRNAHFYLMREKGKLMTVRTSGLPIACINSACYDGRYVWLCYQNPEDVPFLSVFDPEEFRVYDFGPESGLPLVDPATLPKGTTLPRFLATPIGPGRAVLAGTMGRSWIGLATFAPKEGCRIEVIHEARDLYRGKGAPIEASASVAFAPTCAFTLESPTGERRAVVGRESPSADIQHHPLIIDPVRKTVTVSATKIEKPLLFQQGIVRDGAVYYVDANKKTHALVRFEFPGAIVPTGIDNVPPLSARFVGDHIFMTSTTDWYVGSLSNKEVRRVSANNLKFPGGVEGWGTSNHYGYLVGGFHLPHENWATYQLNAAASQADIK
jgi:hypothetical protein